ncbi:hypothetical protein JCM8547_008478 [Rhodosporidiobolus lusitaniae]
MILLLSWYSPKEVGFRIALYQCATTLGGIFAGVFQAALYTNLDGAHGLRGYQWLFIVNSLITGAVAFYGYYALPDYPNKPNPWSKSWLKQRHIDAALARRYKPGRKLPSGWTKKNLLAVFASWRIDAVWFAYGVVVQAGGGTGYFNLLLKSLKNADGTARYLVEQLNHIPIAGNVWDVSDTTKFASFPILNMTAPSTNLFVEWVASLAQKSAEERSVIISCLVIGAYVFNANAPPFTWSAKEAPHYRIGWNYAAAMYGVIFPAFAVVIFLACRQQKQEQREGVVEDQEASVSASASTESIEDK